MDRNKNCSACNIKLDQDKYKRDRTICKDCYKKKARKNNIKNTLIQNEQTKIDNVNKNNNNETLLIGSSFSGKTYLMLKILSRIPTGDICLITKSPEQY